MGNTIIKNPVLIICQNDDGTVSTMVCGKDGNFPYDARGYGLLLCDAARHIARALGDESEIETIYEWFKMELDRPSTKLTGGSVS